MSKVKFSKENLFTSSEKGKRELEEALKENLVVTPVKYGEEGTCKGCFFNGNRDYSICHLLDCNGYNHIFTKEG
jgi:hypothetical protein